MRFKVGDRVALTKDGRAHFRNDPDFIGACATVRAIHNDCCACEFDFTNKHWLHRCNGECASLRGRYLKEYEIELAHSFEIANIAEIL